MTNKVSYYRNKKGWSQEQLARIANVSKSTINRLESNQNMDVMMKSGLKLADALGIGVEKLFKL